MREFTALREESLSGLKISEMKTSEVEMESGNLVSFVTRSQDGKYLVAGGFDKILHIFQEGAEHNKYPLTYYAYCCHLAGDLLYIGGMNFI